MSAPKMNITIQKGRTFNLGCMCASHEKGYLPIEAMPSKAPVRLTITGHGLPDGWPVQITSVRRPQELNTEGCHYLVATVVDDDTIELNDLNATAWSQFTPSGTIEFWKPMDMTDWSCRAEIRDRIGGKSLFTWHSDAAKTPDGEIEIEGSVVTLKMTPADTEALDWKAGVYDVEIISPTGEVFTLVDVSSVVVQDEVTTWE